MTKRVQRAETKDELRITLFLWLSVHYYLLGIKYNFKNTGCDKIFKNISIKAQIIIIWVYWLTIIGRHSSDEIRRYSRLNTRRQRRWIRKNAALIRSGRTGRWKFALFGIQKSQYTMVSLYFLIYEKNNYKNYV